MLQYNSPLCLPFVEFREGQDLDSNQILIRNCTMLIVYLGLSTAYLASDEWKDTGDERFDSLLSGDKGSHTPQYLSLSNSDSSPNATSDVSSSKSKRFVIQAMAYHFGLNVNADDIKQFDGILHNCGGSNQYLLARSCE